MITAISLGSLSRSDPTSARGAASVIYRPVLGMVPDSDFDDVSKTSEDIVAKLRAGTLTGEKALTIASRIRRFKHVNPMLGVIAAYLYDAAGDRDSIRRVAWFYPMNEQPIPFDVALLAGLKGRRDLDGSIRLNIPPVPGRQPLTDEERAHPEYFLNTTQFDEVLVAGGFPWLRQGWALLDVAALPVHPSVVEIASHVLPTPFTTLDEYGGAKLANLLDHGERL
jgi:hypothetical protein